MPQGIVDNHLSNKTLSKCLPLTIDKLWKVCTKELYLIMRRNGSVDTCYTIKP